MTRKNPSNKIGGEKIKRVVAFSDYRVQDIPLLTRFLRSLNPQADLILYAGDDIERFNPQQGKNLFENLAKLSEYGLCAVEGNDDLPNRERITGKNIFNVHKSPLIVDNFIVVGQEGAPIRPDLKLNLGFLLYEEERIYQRLNDFVNQSEVHCCANQGR